MNSRFRTLAPLTLLLLIAGIVAVAGTANGQKQSNGTTRLYLKDGSYMVVGKFEVVGERVRYYSVDRDEWEEIPKSLVDFSATRDWTQKLQKQQAGLIRQAKKITAQPLEYIGPSGYQVAPGVQLPPGPGIFAYDGIRVIRLVQTPGELVRDKRRMAVKMATLPIVKNRDYVEISGKRSDIRIEIARPTFYVESAGLKPAELRLLSLRATRSTRIVEAIQNGLGLGRSGEIRTSLPYDASRVASGIYKITPRTPLASGEYAFGWILGGKLNLDVWDFEIEAQASSNKTPPKPSPKRR